MRFIRGDRADDDVAVEAVRQRFRRLFGVPADGVLHEPRGLAFDGLASEPAGRASGGGLAFDGSASEPAGRRVPGRGSAGLAFGRSAWEPAGRASDAGLAFDGSASEPVGRAFRGWAAEPVSQALDREPVERALGAYGSRSAEGAFDGSGSDRALDGFGLRSAEGAFDGSGSNRAPRGGPALEGPASGPAGRGFDRPARESAERTFDGWAAEPVGRALDREPVERALGGSGSRSAEGALDGSGSERARRALAGFGPERRGVRALAVVVAVAVLLAAFLAWRSRPRPEPVATTAGSTSVSDTPQLVFVSVAGRVHKPGVYRLPAGSRVADAIDAAGGALPGTDLSSINPARRLVDGEQIVVGASAPPGSAAARLVNLNTATIAELDALPGVGPVLAQRIVDYRVRAGGFRSVSDLRKVEGVGDAKYAELKDLVTV